MESVFNDFKRAIEAGDGYGVASTISPVPPPSDPGRLYSFHRSTNSYSVQTDFRYAIVYNNDIQLNKMEGNSWVDVFVAYWKAIGELLLAEELTNQAKGSQAPWGRVYEAWKEMATVLLRGYTGLVFPAWTVPCLYVAGKYLRVFAIKADEQAAQSNGEVTFNAGFQDDIVSSMGKNETLEDAARQINRIFAACISDRAPLEESRKWALYYITNLLFKTYFKASHPGNCSELPRPANHYYDHQLNSISLSKNVLRSLQASQADIPPLEAFPKAHQVTFKYYAGVVAFLEEDYARAEEHLTEAYRLCHKDAQKNRELILTYLIPCHLLTTHTLPTQALLAPYPRLQRHFTPLATCIKRGDLAGFDAALHAGEAEFVKRRIYLTLERGETLRCGICCARSLSRGFEPAKESEEGEKVRRTRVPIAEFAAAIRLGSGGVGMDMDEVECMVANCIYKNLMKGYIARERGIVVLSKGGQAFPGTGV
ncbi:COP9 signalosome (CSN) subunit [Coniosporium tulheliwenetii]|uniref:COP9 signalosome (CSN) subunit n=1 Tax=Coniosporium tulheliwenetii TaxID=3383036 RepID=A0ACC2ZF34_9PEZI|nr:COP9 signalosome (CSN) subunit [Cladosporium sp. JES 115]